MTQMIGNIVTENFIEKKLLLVIVDERIFFTHLMKHFPLVWPLLMLFSFSQLLIENNVCEVERQSEKTSLLTTYRNFT